MRLLLGLLEDSQNTLLTAEHFTSHARRGPLAPMPHPCTSGVRARLCLSIRGRP